MERIEGMAVLIFKFISKTSLIEFHEVSALIVSEPMDTTYVVVCPFQVPDTTYVVVCPQL